MNPNWICQLPNPFSDLAALGSSLQLCERAILTPYRSCRRSARHVLSFPHIRK